MSTMYLPTLRHLEVFFNKVHSNLAMKFERTKFQVTPYLFDIQARNNNHENTPKSIDNTEYFPHAILPNKFLTQHGNILPISLQT